MNKKTCHTCKHKRNKYIRKGNYDIFAKFGCSFYGRNRFRSISNCPYWQGLKNKEIG